MTINVQLIIALGVNQRVGSWVFGDGAWHTLKNPESMREDIGGELPKMLVLGNNC